MFEFQDSIFIQRAPQDVFDVISDPTKSVQWQSSLESGEWTSEAPFGAGSTWKVKMKFMGRTLEADLEVTEWEPPNRVSFKTLKGPVPMEAINVLQPQDNGTLLTFSGQIEFGGFFKVAEGLAGKQAVKQMESDNQNLKLLMESNQL